MLHLCAGVGLPLFVNFHKQFCVCGGGAGMLRVLGLLCGGVQVCSVFLVFCVESGRGVLCVFGFLGRHNNEYVSEVSFVAIRLFSRFLRGVFFVPWCPCPSTCDASVLACSYFVLSLFLSSLVVLSSLCHSWYCLETHGFVPLCSRHRPFVTSLGHYVPAFGQVVRTGDVSLCECSQHVRGPLNFL